LKGGDYVKGNVISKRQEVFANEYLIDLNGKQAAIRAGYSPKTAEAQASTLLRNIKVVRAIDTQRAKLQEKVEISQQTAIDELAIIALADMADYGHIDVVSTPTATRQEFIVKDLKMLGVKSKAISSIRNTPTGIEIKLHDKMKAIEMVCKLLGIGDLNASNVDATEAVKMLVDALTGNNET
jgi:phage terminase small subunit